MDYVGGSVVGQCVQFSGETRWRLNVRSLSAVSSVSHSELYALLPMLEFVVNRAGIKTIRSSRRSIQHAVISG